MRLTLLLLLIALLLGLAEGASILFYDFKSVHKGLVTFSTLWQELEARGHLPSTLTRELRALDLEGVDVLVIGDLEKSLSPQELAAILSFVHRGGGLFVCGEGEALNSFLPAFGILLDQHYLEALRESRLDERDARSFIATTFNPGRVLWAAQLVGGLGNVAFLGAKGVYVADPRVTTAPLIVAGWDVYSPPSLLFSKRPTLPEERVVVATASLLGRGGVVYVADCDSFTTEALAALRDQDNLGFFLNSVDWLAGLKPKEPLDKVRAKRSDLQLAMEVGMARLSLEEVKRVEVNLRGRLNQTWQQLKLLEEEISKLERENEQLGAFADPLLRITYAFWACLVVACVFFGLAARELRRTPRVVRVKAEEEEVLSAEELLERIGVEEKPEEVERPSEKRPKERKKAKPS